jgi:tetratricopeptide (TPR) repeat protein
MKLMHPMRRFFSVQLTEDPDELDLEFRELIEEYPDDPFVLSEYAVYLLQGGNTVFAEILLDKAINLIKNNKFFSPDFEEEEKEYDAQYSYDFVSSLESLANTLFLTGKLDEAEMIVEISLLISRKKDENSREQVGLLKILSLIFKEKGDLARSEIYAKESLQCAKELVIISHKKLRSDENCVANSIENLALILQKAEKMDEAERLLMELLQYKLKSESRKHFLIPLFNKIADFLANQNKQTEALELYRTALTSYFDFKREITSSSESVQNIFDVDAENSVLGYSKVLAEMGFDDESIALEIKKFKG